LFFGSEAADAVDRLAWLRAIGPIRYSVVNEFGSHVVFFPNLIRGEFHFATDADIASVATWPARGAPTDEMIVLDRTGALRRALDSLPAQPALPTSDEEIEELCGRFANWLVLAHHVGRRGELLRAIDALSHAQRHLLWMARLAEDQTQHWLTPSRLAEADLSRRTIDAMYATAPRTNAQDIRRASAAAWACGRGYWLQLANRHHFTIPLAFFDELDAATRR
jgi:lincosamide nucleotidyltransferase